MLALKSLFLASITAMTFVCAAQISDAGLAKRDDCFPGKSLFIFVHVHHIIADQY
jgi:hypothetical protein